MTKIKSNINGSYQDYFDKDLSLRDPDLYNSIKLELQRQQEHIELIASENIVSKAVLDAQGSILTTSTQKDTLEKDIMEDVNLSIKQKN